MKNTIEDIKIKVNKAAAAAEADAAIDELASSIRMMQGEERIKACLKQAMERSAEYHAAVQSFNKVPKPRKVAADNYIEMSPELVAVWFHKHRPSESQIKDAARMGYELTVTPEGIALGSLELRDNGDVRACVSALLGHCSATGAVAIFGVFTPPLLARIARTAEDIRQRGHTIEPDGGRGDYPCFAAWNISRPNGGKSALEHKNWLWIGYLNQESCRWL